MLNDKWNELYLSTDNLKRSRSGKSDHAYFDTHCMQDQCLDLHLNGLIEKNKLYK